MIESFLTELDRAVRARGRARRRFLAECREHLADLARDQGEAAAVQAFGAPVELAAAFDTEVATARGVRAAWLASVGVVAAGGSTLALINAADPGVHAPTFWTIAFAGAAQIAAVCVALVLLQAWRLRRGVCAPSDLVLLCRRMAIGIVSAGLAMFAAGAALPGHGSALSLLAGPVLAAVATIAVVRTWLLARRLDGAAARTDRSPYADLSAILGLRIPALGPISLAVLAAIAAFIRDHGESGSTLSGSIIVGAVEAALVVAAYVALSRPLGLRGLRA